MFRSEAEAAGDAVGPRLRKEAGEDLGSGGKARRAEAGDLGSAVGALEKVRREAGLPVLTDVHSAGQVAVVQGLGYPNPNLSHFSSMGIWMQRGLGGCHGVMIRSASLKTRRFRTCSPRRAA